VRDATGNVEAPKQAAGELLGAKVLEFLESHKVDGRIDQLAAACTVAHVERAEAVHVLACGELVEDGDLLRNHANAALELVAGGAHGLAKELYLAVVVREELQDAVDGRGLARAVGAEKPKDLAGSDVQRQVVHRHQLPVALDQVANANDRLVRRHAGSSRLPGESVARRTVHEK
jgi:hypothetical protein